MRTSADVGRELLDALSERDFERFAQCFTEDARLRALVPTAVREDEGPQAIAARFRLWFGDLGNFRVARSELDQIADRIRASYRLEGDDQEDGPSVVEQQAYLTIEDGRISAINLVCSGFRPAS